MRVKSLHGISIDYSHIKYLPTRKAFLNQNLYEQVNIDISDGNPLLFMPSDLHEMHLQEKKYDKSKYNIVLFGALLDGRRATVVINGIKPYFEVMLPMTEDTSEIAMKLFNSLKQIPSTCPDSFEVIKGRKFKGYQKEKRTFVKFYFEKLKLRQEAIKEVRSKGYETTSDDTSSYYRMVCRDYLTTFSSWVYLSKYAIKTYPSIRGSVYTVDISTGGYTKCDEDITENPLLAKDNIMTACWDIETYSPDGQLPRPDDLSHKMFMIGLTFQWHHASDQLLRVCLVEHPCKPRPNYITIVCGDEKKLIKAFGKLVFKMKPEYCIGFNDSDYDWPWLIKRGNHYPGVLTFLAECFDSTIHWKNYNDKEILAYNFKKEHVKIEADTYADGYSLVFPGYINIDVRTIFRQLYPTAEKSNLNFYLALNKLGGKKDMEYQELFRIYRELNALILRRTTIKESFKQFGELSKCMDIILEYVDITDYENLTNLMAEIAEYCVIDSQRCHELMNIRSIIMDRREVAVMSYTTMFDSLYRANGMKVRNLVIARGQQFGIKFSNITNNGEMGDGKYPGAYVFPPKKGLVTSKPTIQERIDHATLMKNYEEWIEVTPDELITYKKIIDEYGAYCTQESINIIQDSYNIRKCFIDFLLEPTGRPIPALDFSSLYPSLIMTYNLSPEYIIINQKEARQAQDEGHNLYKIKFMFNGAIVRGWSIRHDNKLDPEEKDCKFGVYPMILKELFDARNQMKKGLHKWESEKEKLETLPREEFAKPEIQTEYANVCFNHRYIDSKQRALKVFMNTFYGESGNKRSPFFVLQLAGAITTSGQDSIKMVQKFVEKESCELYYGDSVTGDTPLILRNRVTKQVLIKTIDDLAVENEWKSYDQFKPGSPNRICKQQAECNLQIWTEGDWYDIRRVIRHKTNKKMYRVQTYTGCIDVTEDHSLMTPDRTKIKPGELKVGDMLMHSFPIVNINYNLPKIQTQYFCDKLSAQKGYYMLRLKGYNILVDSFKDAETGVYMYKLTHVNQFNKNPKSVKKIMRLHDTNQETFVYDIETTKGSFNGGIGALTCFNTDSLYFSMPEKYFVDLDKRYFTGGLAKLDYWNELVNITLNTITHLKDAVNNMLYEDNGTWFLKMSFEEALFPVAFLAKKKYYGIPHISVPNFQPKSIFIRGLEVKKRGVSEFLRKVCMNIMWNSVNILNIYTLMQLVEKKIDEIYATEWDFSDFVMTDVYKPLKKNVKVQTFVARMLHEGVIIKPYERFSHVITKKNPFKYDERGRKKTLQIGEKMELSERASEKKMEIDLDYYMKGSINGQLSRLITYDYTFHVEPVGDELDDLKIAEDKTYQNACKHIEKYCGKYYTNYQSKGKIYQKIFRMANNIVVSNLEQHCCHDTVSILDSNYDIENLEEWLTKKAEKNALKCIKGYGKEHVSTMICNLEKPEKRKKIKELQDVYFANKKNNLLILQERAFKERHTLLQRQIRDNISGIILILNYNTGIISKVSEKIKSIINIDNEFNNPDDQVPLFDAIHEVQNIDMQELNRTATYEIEKLMENETLYTSLNKLRCIYINMLSNYNFIHKTRSVVDYLKSFRNKTLGIVVKPNAFNAKKYINDNVSEILKDL